MAWQVSYRKTALKQLRKLDNQIAARILDYLDEAASLDNPRDRGKAPTGDKSGLWRYRIGNYRVICLIDDEQFVILALEVGHRSNIY